MSDQILDEHLALEPDERALLTVLLLRGAQAPGELRTRTERLHGFADRGQVEECLRRMASRPQPLVCELERRPGQQDPRWIHLLGAASEQSSSETDPAGSADSSRIRVTQIIADPHGPTSPPPGASTATTSGWPKRNSTWTGWPATPRRYPGRRSR